ncbi:MAG: hypothetical protein WBO24_20895 [Nitrospirales bacterium]
MRQMSSWQRDPIDHSREWPASIFKQPGFLTKARPKGLGLATIRLQNLNFS